MIRIELNEGKLAQHDQVFVKLKALVADIKSDEKYVVSKKQSSTKFHILTSREIDFIDYLADNNHAKLQWIVDSDAKEITDKVIDEIETKFYELKKDRAKAGKKRAHFSPVYKLAEYLFVKNGYNKLTDKSQFYDATDIHVCPYCNVTEIWPIKEKGRKDTVKGELDHYYCKSRFPYLAFSKYNLIPSCRVCNGKSRKGSKDFYKTQVQHPYLLTTSDGMHFGYRNTRHKNVRINDVWLSFFPVYKFSPNAALAENFKEFRLKPIYEDVTHRELIYKTEGVVRGFCNKEYIESAEKTFFAPYNLKMDFRSLLRHDLMIESDPSKYSHYPNNKFLLDIFYTALNKINGTLLVK